MTHNLRTNQIIAAILFIIFGIILTVYPGSTLVIVCSIIGVGVLIYGIVSLIGAVRKKEPVVAVLGAVLCIIIGIFLLTQPGFLASILPFVIGIVMIVNAIVNLANAGRNRILMGPRYIPSMTGNVLLLILGIIIVMNPFSTASLLIRMIGISIVIGGVVNLISIVQK